MPKASLNLEGENGEMWRQDSGLDSGMQSLDKGMSPLVVSAGPRLMWEQVSGIKCFDKAGN